MTTELVLCGAEAPFAGVDEACPLEAGHDGGHVFWSQSKPHAKRGRNGIWIFNEAGQRIVHADFDGAVDAETVCALLGIQRAVADQRSSS